MCINHGDQRFIQFEIIINFFGCSFRFISIPIYQGSTIITYQTNAGSRWYRRLTRWPRFVPTCVLCQKTLTQFWFNVAPPPRLRRRANIEPTLGQRLSSPEFVEQSCESRRISLMTSKVSGGKLCVFHWYDAPPALTSSLCEIRRLGTSQCTVVLVVPGWV